MWQHDVLIVGSVLAGMRAVRGGSNDPTLEVTILSKVHPLRSDSGAAHRGIAAFLDNSP